MKKLLNDVKAGLLIASIIGPLPFVGIFDLPKWILLIYLAWIGLVMVANAPFIFRKPKQKKERKFITFEIDEEEKAS